ncbi:Pyrrolidone-carboxylate peptidase [Corynebacterium kutscheri]|uniref:Pyroglutamyl-peptidase I n=1 Tax=Corynebacterium kutscheri TaxID=35755 RepID=A0A0F6R1X0_9CORY|nr:pyroglutamyl-peptidase I [Corynebacterium kutscheri]AKE42120.1 pyroglutamyl peptidase I [Corynebacterium kutscheri]VEH05941.1 Pyrrolidone-carboxylate peptidase [Corynebacterium kutscheri]VEH10463.1 Pyrrolidone-carboxylate peptidase [Corynebacterium kutscheri]VEH81830.1 Pyrrolidone-carboxylate peptidase [Corynebacterium kutscheri]
MTVTVLLTGFEPFAGATINESWLAVQAAKQIIESQRDSKVYSEELPVEFHTAGSILTKRVAELKPQIVVACGLANGRKTVSIERVAINIRDAAIADNTGNQPIDEAIVTGGDVGYFTTLPIKRCMQVLKEHDLPVNISQTAGTYVCNEVFYTLMRTINAQKHPARAGFVHIPAQKDLIISECATALALIVITTLDSLNSEDACLAGGAIY